MSSAIPVDRIPHGGGPSGGEGEFGGSGRPSGSSRRVSMTGIYVLFAAIIMVFAAFTSAMVVRRGLGTDWVSITLPPVLWFNTAALAASSVVLELARRALRDGERSAFHRYWLAGTILGMLFLAGQFAVWSQLHAAGIYVATNPSSSFFFLLTVVHAVHLGGGLAAVLYIEWQAVRLRLGPAKRTAVEVSCVYWHFLGALWIYLMLLFWVWG